MERLISSSDMIRRGIKARAGARMLTAPCAVVFDGLEARRLLAAPFILGPSVVGEGSSYALTLDPGDAAGSISSWTIDWGDGAVDEVQGSPATVTHVYADGLNRFQIRGTAHTSSGDRQTSMGLSAGAYPEPTFGPFGNGQSLVQIDSTSQWTSPNEAVVLPDGRLLQVGGYGAGGGRIQLTRHLTNGALDPSFGVGGKVAGYPGIPIAFASGVALQPDGKIVVSASVTNTHYDVTVVRFNADGTIDPTFGTGGVVTQEYAGDVESAKDILVEPGGRILVGGDARTDDGFVGVSVLALNPDGTVDTTFGTQGWTTYEFPGSMYTSGEVLARQADGKIVVGGRAQFTNWEGPVGAVVRLGD